MLSNVSASSLPIFNYILSSELLPHINQLLLPLLSYKIIQQSPNQSNNNRIRAVSSFDLSDALPAHFLAIVKDDIKEFESGSGNKNIQGRREKAEEVAVNEIFLNEELGFKNESEDEFEKESDKKSDKEFNEKSDDKSDKKSDNKSDWELDDKSEQNNQARLGLTATHSTIYTRKKLVKILNGEAVVPKQQWDIDKILISLTYYQKDKRLQSLYQRFKRFAFNSLLKEFDKLSDQLPGILTQKDWDLMIKLWAKSELEKYYCQEVQSFWRTLCFGVAKTKPEVIN